MDTTGSRAGIEFGPYQLRTLLGKGGMGEVYEAYDTVKQRVVAVKLLPAALAGDPQFERRFRHESLVAARLAEPHVVPIHDWGEIDGVLYIDMRLVRGSDLRTVLRAKGPMSPAQAVGIIEQVAAALDAAHAEGLVHRDVKPANILVTPSDFAYLADFGIARSEGDPSLTTTGHAVGSYSYIAPERFDTSPITGTSDVYSLTCVLFECLTGAQPFPADGMSSLMRSHLSTPPPRPTTKRAGLPAALDEVISRGMAKEPADRYPTAGALAAAARAAISRLPVLPNSELPTEEIGRGRRRAPATVVFPAIDNEPRQRPTRSAMPAGDATTEAISRPAVAPRPMPQSPAPYPPLGPPASANRREPVRAMWIGALIVVLMVAGILAWQGRGALTERTPAPPAGPAVLPAGAQPCPQVYPVLGRFSASAIGSIVTSCPFAEEVRKAYADSGDGQPVRSVVAYSQAQDADYTMDCTTTDGFVTCTGGLNAIVYVY